MMSKKSESKMPCVAMGAATGRFPSFVDWSVISSTAYGTTWARRQTAFNTKLALEVG
jgi:hypothetical protein